MSNVEDRITKDTLNLFLLLDVSGSMGISGRIQQVNSALPALKEKLIELAEDNSVDVMLRIITFADGENWLVGSVEQGVKIEDVTCPELHANGATSTSKAIMAANRALKVEYLGTHALHPVVILITDGGCTDSIADYLSAIETMKMKLAHKEGDKKGIEKVLRIAVGVDQCVKEQLEAFASEGIISDVKQPLVFEIDKATNLGDVINWVSATSLVASITDDDIPDLGDPDWVE